MNADRSIPEQIATDRERRLELLVRRLPQRLQTGVRWLRQPSARWVRVPTGIVLILGGMLAILPVLGLWMLPLGLMLLAEDVPPLRRMVDRWLHWIEHRRPHWMGLPRKSPDTLLTCSSSCLQLAGDCRGR